MSAKPEALASYVLGGSSVVVVVDDDQGHGDARVAEEVGGVIFGLHV